MADEIKIEGEKYTGRFSIEQKTSEHDVYIDGEYAGARWEKTRISWLEGRGVVEDTSTGNRERFLFVPKGNSQGDVIPYLKGEELMDKERVDLALNLLYERVRESGEINPKVNLELTVSSFC